MRRAVILLAWWCVRRGRSFRFDNCNYATKLEVKVYSSHSSPPSNMSINICESWSRFDRESQESQRREDRRLDSSRYFGRGKRATSLLLPPLLPLLK